MIEEKEMNLKNKVNLIMATAVLLMAGVAIYPSISPDWMTVIAWYAIGAMAIVLSNDPIIMGK